MMHSFTGQRSSMTQGDLQPSERCILLWLNPAMPIAGQSIVCEIRLTVGAHCSLEVELGRPICASALGREAASATVAAHDRGWDPKASSALTTGNPTSTAWLSQLRSNLQSVSKCE